MYNPYSFTTEQGFTILEVLVVLAVLAILLSIAALNLNTFSDPLQNATREVTATLTQTRARAMKTTSAIRVTFPTPTELRAHHASTCDASPTAWETDPTVHLQLRQRVQITAVTPTTAPTEKPLCFNSRGLANDAFTITLSDDRGRHARLKVYLGGAVQQESP